MSRATSRLKTNQTIRMIRQPSKEGRLKNDRSIEHLSQIKKNIKNKKSSQIEKCPHLAHLASLFLAIAFILIYYLFLTNIHPEQIRHFIFPNTYLPLLLINFFTVLFFSSWLFLNTRRGLMIALLTTIYLFLKLQQIEFSSTMHLAIILPLVIFELALLLINRTS